MAFALRSSTPSLASRQAPSAGRLAGVPARNRVVARAAVLPQDVKTVSPLGGRVLVRPRETETKTSGGILLPSTAQKKPTVGDIVDAGTATTVKSGDRVLYSKYAGTEVDLSSESLMILKEEDVIGLAPSEDLAQLSPLGDRVLVRVAEAAEETSGGLILTESAREVPTVGTVLAVGPGKKPAKGAEGKDDDEPVAVKKDDKVLYQRYAGTELSNPDGSKFIVVRGKDILAVVA